ncbi:hypothetical protein CEUSTIGMA_g5193.t1 [Chlamydomonas eustigma]|uniref:Uncharacterized protein n=1 Tax=Chlamydomonas eustigma TaxID=1157962 RepID=A0A250X4R1_9CHLO|nr:hypothetical protein CEUSTIGMA_g5193.t1 [Chlamydomonas eustigma]|eukprot:GAX77750.1 hypothetical protein CEUSTIGMA_g5193.t1 [Chlamydomonas eustigma]
MPIETFWVTAGSAAALGNVSLPKLGSICVSNYDNYIDSTVFLLLVGATLAATVTGAMIASSGLDRMVDPDLLEGEEGSGNMEEIAPESKGRTRLKPEDVLKETEPKTSTKEANS